MDMKINILSLASNLASHSAARQQVVSENIAHADTPGYRARDISDFATTLRDSELAFAARQTREGHLPFGNNSGGYTTREISAFGAESPNGNTVSLEDQMMRAAHVRQNHDMAMGVYGKSLEILRATIGK